MGADSSQLHNLIVTVQRVSLLFVVNDCTNDLVICLYLNIQTSPSIATQLSPDQAAMPGPTQISVDKMTLSE